MNNTPAHVRFREARERLGLLPDELAITAGIPQASVWDIEECEGDLTCGYSPAETKKFCAVLQIHPSELFGERITESQVSAEELVRLIEQECDSRGITLEQFEDVVGWRLSACIDPPEKLLSDITVDGLQWLCRELRIDWRRAL